MRFSELLDHFFYRPDEDVGALVDFGAPGEDVPEAAEEAAPAEYLSFKLEAEVYAVPIGDVREIVRVPVLTEIPRGPDALLGVMNLRGEVLPVYDAKMRLHLTTRPSKVAGAPEELDALPKQARILVMRGEEGDGGVLVDAVHEVVRLRPSAIEPPPPGIAAGDRDLVTGLGRRREQLYILVDLKQVV